MFRDAGYELAHHGEGRWNGVAIASRVGIADVVTNFGEPLRAAPDRGRGRRRAAGRGADDLGVLRRHPGRLRLRAQRPDRRLHLLRRPSCAWFDRLARWLAAAAKPTSRSCWAATSTSRRRTSTSGTRAACHGGTHVSEPERKAFARLLEWGFVDIYRQQHPEPERYTWWDYRAGNFHKNYGMRIDHLLVSAAGRDPRRVDRDRPRDAQGQAHAVRPHAARDRPRRAGPPLRRRLGLRRGAHRRTAAPVILEPPIEPMLAKLAHELPDGDGWLFEPKWDGFRALVFRDGERVYLQSRDLKPLDRYFPELAAPLRAALPERCVVDGEIVIATDGGLDFDALQMRLHPAASRVAKLAAETPSSFVAFDLLARGRRGPPRRARRPSGRARLEAALARARRPHPPHAVHPGPGDRRGLVPPLRGRRARTGSSPSTRARPTSREARR